MRTKTKGRNGLHKPGTVRVQITLDRRKKAILVYTASLIGCTLTDLLIGEGLGAAKRRNVIDDQGLVTAEHQDGVSLAYDLLETQAQGDK